MATSAQICIKLKNGKLKGVRCNYDGYLKHTGKILLENYNTSTLITKLISLGDISVLEPKMNKPAGHTFSTPIPGHTIFYGRDRGEKNTSAKTYDTIKEIFDYENVDYVYVFDKEMNKWLFCKFKGPVEILENYVPTSKMAKGGKIDESALKEILEWMTFTHFFDENPETGRPISDSKFKKISKQIYSEWDASKDNYNDIQEYFNQLEENGDYQIFLFEKGGMLSVEEEKRFQELDEKINLHLEGKANVSSKEMVEHAKLKHKKLLETNDTYRKQVKNFKYSKGGEIQSFIDDFILDDVDWDDISTKSDLMKNAKEIVVSNLSEYGITKFENLSKEQQMQVKTIVDDEWNAYKTNERMSKGGGVGEDISFEIGKGIADMLKIDWGISKDEYLGQIVKDLGLVKGEIQFFDTYFTILGETKNGDKLFVEQNGEYTMYGGPYTPKMEYPTIELNDDDIYDEVKKEYIDYGYDSNGTAIDITRTDIWGSVLSKLSKKSSSKKEPVFVEGDKVRILQTNDHTGEKYDLGETFTINFIEDTGGDDLYYGENKEYLFHPSDLELVESGEIPGLSYENELNSDEVDDLYEIEPKLFDPYYPKELIRQVLDIAYYKVIIKGAEYLLAMDTQGNWDDYWYLVKQSKLN